MRRIIFLVFLILAGCNGTTGPQPPSTTPTTGPAVEEVTIHARGFTPRKNRDRGVTFWRSLLKTALPDTFDWRDQGADLPVKDQGQCGSCWAFASIATLESSMAIFSHKTMSLSEQQIVSCDRNFGGCGGGDYSAYMVNPGSTLTANFPYQASDVRCKSGLSVDAKGLKEGAVGAPGRAPTEDEMKQAIMQYGYVAVDVAAGGDWDSYRGGPFTRCSSRGINHLVSLVGWNKDGFILRNSWGTSWGDKGYIDSIKLGCDQMGQDANFIVTSAAPVQPLVLHLPAEYLINPGDPVTMAVLPQDGVSYTWMQGSAQIGTGPEMTVSPAEDTLYNLIAKNTQGEAEAQTLVAIKK